MMGGWVNTYLKHRPVKKKNKNKKNDTSLFTAFFSSYLNKLILIVIDYRLNLKDLIPGPYHLSYELNSITVILLQGRLWH